MEIAIRSRTGHDWRRARRLPHAPLEALDESEMMEVEDALATTASVSNVEDAFATIEVLAKVRDLATRDPAIQALLDAICAGHTERMDLMHAAGMSKREYRAARRRLDKLLEELPTATAGIRSRVQPAGEAAPVDVPLPQSYGQLALASIALQRVAQLPSTARTHLRTIRATAGNRHQAAPENAPSISRPIEPGNRRDEHDGFSSVMGACRTATK